MPAFRKILFPVDFSPRCEATVPFVTDMARIHNASITLLNAVQQPAPWFPPDGGIPVVGFDIEEFLGISRQRLEDFKQNNFAGLAPEIAVDEFHEEGDPALSIVEYARRNQVDLIMMPTHGFGLFRSLLLGSVAAKVLHDTECAVWTGVHMEEEQVKEHANVKNILCAVDLQARTAFLIANALQIAAEHSATLGLVHCVPGTDAVPDRYFDGEFERSLMATAREEIGRIQSNLNTNLIVSIEAGEVSKVIRAAALNHHADLVVIGRGVLQAPLGRLRTNAYAIIRESPCPVLSF